MANLYSGASESNTRKNMEKERAKTGLEVGIAVSIKLAKFRFNPDERVYLPNGKEATVDHQTKVGVFLKEFPGQIFCAERLSR